MSRPRSPGRKETARFPSPREALPRRLLKARTDRLFVIFLDVLGCCETPWDSTASEQGRYRPAENSQNRALKKLSRPILERSSQFDSKFVSFPYRLSTLKSSDGSIAVAIVAALARRPFAASASGAQSPRCRTFASLSFRQSFECLPRPSLRHRMPGLVETALALCQPPPSVRGVPAHPTANQMIEKTAAFLSATQRETTTSVV
jgi:hypothetical protein